MIVFRTSLIFSNTAICPELWLFFFNKNNSKIHSLRPNTIKETLHWPGILGKLILWIVFRTSLVYFSDTAVLSHVMAIVWIKIAQKCIPGVKHIDGKLALTWYFMKTFWEIVIRASFIFGFDAVIFCRGMAFLVPIAQNTMTETKRNDRNVASGWYFRKTL